MNRQDFNIVRQGDRPSASQQNKLTKAVSGLTSSAFTQGYTDSSGHHTRRPVAVPGTGVRLAFCKNDAGAQTWIVCYLDVDHTGTEVTVQFRVSGGGNCNSALPDLQDGDWITVYQDLAGTWRCTTILIPKLNCTC